MGEKALLKGNKLFRLLELLSKKELNQLASWLEASVHNNSDEVRALFRGLKRHFGKFDKGFEKNLLLKYLHQDGGSTKPEKEDAVLRSVMFKLTQQIQEFLIWQTLQQEARKKEFLLIDCLIDRRGYDQALSVVQKAKKTLDKENIWSDDKLEHSLHLAEFDFVLDVLTQNRNAHLQLQSLLNSLNEHAVVRLLKYYCAATNIENIRKITLDLPMRDEVMGYLANNPEHDPLIKSYSLLLQILEDSPGRHYYDLKELLQENLEHYSLSELRQFLNHLTNYCRRKIKQGQLEFVEEIYDVFSMGLKQECWSAGVYFSVHQFIRIIQNRLRLDKIEEAESFEEAYTSKLDPGSSQSIQMYGKALIAFKKREFDVALELVNQIENSEDFIYHVQYKVLRSMIFYEMKEYLQPNRGKSLLEYELDAIRHFVISGRNTKMSEHLRSSYNNFVNIFKRILNRVKPDIGIKKVDAETKSKLFADLETLSPLAERLWLAERIKEL